MLADSLVYQERSRYPRSTALELSWGFRSVGLLEEIKRWKPSVLCLQEVDEHHYESFWKPKLVAEGYSAGEYQERTVSKSPKPVRVRRDPPANVTHCMRIASRAIP